jgi:hypothetical protein
MKFADKSNMVTHLKRHKNITTDNFVKSGSGCTKNYVTMENIDNNDINSSTLTLFTLKNLHINAELALEYLNFFYNKNRNINIYNEYNNTFGNYNNKINSSNNIQIINNGISNELDQFAEYFG